MLPSVVIPILDYRLSTYAILRTIYLLIAVVLVIRLNRRQGIAPDVTLTAFAFGVPAGILGAHVLDMVEYAHRYRGLADVLSPAGSSIYGAFLAVVPVLWLYARSRGVSPLRFLDAGAPAMALGEAVTRLGCFANGCCYGRPWNGSLAVTFPPESFAYRDQLARGLLPPGAPHALPVHPVQLYSATIALAAFAWLLRMFARAHREGAVFYAFLIVYGALRLGMAPLRQEALWSMTAFSVAFIVTGTIGLAFGRQRAAAPAKRTRRLSSVA